MATMQSGRSRVMTTEREAHLALEVLEKLEGPQAHQVGTHHRLKSTDVFAARKVRRARERAAFHPPR